MHIGDLSHERVQAELHTARFGRSLELLATTGLLGGGSGSGDWQS